MFELEAHGQLSLGPRELRIEVRSRAKVLALVGPTGAGKSSVLRFLCGLARPPSAVLKFREQVWQGPETFLPSWQRSVAWQPQDSLLLPHRKVRDALTEYTGVTWQDGETLASELEIGHLLDRYPRHLSGGEKQRVALARALAGRRSLLLLDEPFTALDAAMGQQCLQVIREWSTKAQATVVIVTHRIADLRDWVDEVLAVKGDRVTATADDISGNL